MSNLVIINPRINRHYNEHLYRTRVIGTSDCNGFIPLYSLFAHELMVFGDTRVLEYKLPSEPPFHLYERQYDRLNRDLRTSDIPKRYKFKLSGTEHFICMNRGLLYKDEEILLCLGIKTDYVMSTPIEEIRDNIDTTKLTLFISKEFEDNPTYKNIRRKMDSMYIADVKNQGIDIVFTSRIKNWLFNNNFKQPKFKNVMQLMQHLEQEVPMTLITE